ncbi:hypothetical protein HPB52_013518 [Rhipicephalus sanguineus]|uniref:Uncharacterized protein n=1 Tax=Rhipicephalus sanguineus TaxID=34632 RepID=A0A9D4TAA6_RHISA|nr:hypothetical protein HPB52_013518 [Rhipicephalus sanguineus]
MQAFLADRIASLEATSREQQSHIEHLEAEALQVTPLLLQCDAQRRKLADTQEALTKLQEEVSCTTICRVMREEKEEWHQIAVIRFVGSSILTVRLTQRQIPGWATATGTLLGALVFQILGSSSLVAVVEFTTTESPKMHAAAVVGYAGFIAASRYLYLSGFRHFQLAEEEPLEADLTNVNHVCLGFTASTLVVLWMNSREKSAEWECLGGKLEWLSGTVDAAFLLLSASVEA